MKLNKEDLKKKVNEIVTDNDVAIQLLEDIEDSFDAEVDNSKIDELQAKIDEQQSKIDELQEKYKERFLTGNKEDTTKLNDQHTKVMLAFKDELKDAINNNTLVMQHYVIF